MRDLFGWFFWLLIFHLIFPLIVFININHFICEKYACSLTNRVSNCPKCFHIFWYFTSSYKELASQPTRVEMGFLMFCLKIWKKLQKKISVLVLVHFAEIPGLSTKQIFSWKEKENEEKDVQTDRHKYRNIQRKRDIETARQKDTQT